LKLIYRLNAEEMQVEMSRLEVTKTTEKRNGNGWLMID
jgi:hypothetical protein